MFSALNKYYIVLLTTIFISSCCNKNEKFNAALNDKKLIEAISANKIALLLPASGITKKELEILKSVLPQNVIFDYTTINDGSLYCSCDDITRSKMLNSALQNDDVDIIWSIRGGYGSAKLLQNLSLIKKPQKRKIIVGYSDITALNIFISQNWQWQAVHGAMAIELLNNKKNPQNFLQLIPILEGNNLSQNPHLHTIELSCINNTNNRCNNDITGKITGGNLSIVTTTLGTKWQIITKNKILFLEDISEKGHAVDRYLQHLSNAGALNDVKAVIFGEFTKQQDDLINGVIENFAKNVNFPVFKTTQIGHSRSNFPILYDAFSTIEWCTKKHSYELKYSMKIGEDKIL